MELKLPAQGRMNEAGNMIIAVNTYRVILKKVSFGIFTTFLVSKEEKNFTIESKDKGLFLSKFS